MKREFFKPQFYFGEKSGTIETIQYGGDNSILNFSNGFQFVGKFFTGKYAVGMVE
ncbi:hypothetical protein AALA24_02975 [Anaerovoracaceae bacterium 42-11]